LDTPANRGAPSTADFASLPGVADGAKTIPNPHLAKHDRVRDGAGVRPAE
jgi:hypothetical protein